MSEINIFQEKGLSGLEPNLFHAAEFNDVSELRLALKIGQRLDERNPRLLNMTPVHLACIRASNDFLAVAALNDTCDPWLRDDNLRVAFDHAWAFNNKEAMKIMFKLMYPEEAELVKPPEPR